MKFQIPRYKDFKVGIFRIRPISYYLEFTVSFLRLSLSVPTFSLLNALNVFKEHIIIIPFVPFTIEFLSKWLESISILNSKMSSNFGQLWIFT